MIRFSLSLLAILISAGLAGAQKKSDAKAGSSSTKTSTHRVVIVNGKKIVDEKTVNGKKVPSSGDIDLPSGEDAEEMLRKLRERMRREMGKGLPPGAGKGSSSTHKRRVVVENGKVIVDEETRDGKPVHRNDDGKSSGLGRGRVKKLESRKRRKSVNAPKSDR